VLKCNRVTQLVTTGELTELGFMKKMELKMHVFMCVHCKRYMNQIQAIGRGAREMVGAREADESQIQRMEKDITTRVTGGDT